MNDGEYDEFLIWLENGQKRGWVSKISCYVHDVIPMTDEETAIIDESEDGLDPLCIPVVRIWLG